MYSNRGDFNLAACESIETGAPVISYEYNDSGVCEKITTTPIVYILPDEGSERRIPSETVTREELASNMLCDEP